MKKIAFVTPWYGDTIPGGMEAELRGLVKQLLAAGVELEIVTTCVEKFTADWNVNYHKPGLTFETGVPVRRFSVRKRNTSAFDAVNIKLMRGMNITREEEDIFARETVNSPKLYNWLREYADEYALFVFIPYMYGTTYWGLQVNPKKSILIPCLHDESYIYMKIFKDLFPVIGGMIFHSDPEMALASRVYDLSTVNKAVLGEGIDTDLRGDASAFINKYKIKKPFILYAGRKDAGKNIDLLFTYFSRYKQDNDNGLKLVLIGGGKMPIPKTAKKAGIIDLGFVSIQDKFNAYSAALLLCQPSVRESFSIVIMESWLCERPVLVHGDCAVTKHFAQTANGGLYFKTYREFEGTVNYIVSHPETAGMMGGNGRRFVLDNFSWNKIVNKYNAYFKKMCTNNCRSESVC